MATTATTQWWVRNDGNDANGGSYDAGIAGAATNYCDQAAAQASWTSALTLSAGTLTDTGSSGLFTAAMIGNAVQVAGQGYYWITARTNSNVVTVTPGTGSTTSFTTQSGKLGGAFRNPKNLSNGGSVTAPTTTTALVPGNTVNVRASGSGSVGSPDYTQAGYGSYSSGDTTNGYITWQAYNGTFYMSGDGLMWYNFSNHKWIGGYFVVTGASNGGFGIFGSMTASVLVNCTIDGNNQAVAGFCGTSATATGGGLIGCELKGGGTSSLSGFAPGNYGCFAKNCNIHGWGAWGIQGTGTGLQLSSCAIWNNVSGGVQLVTTSTVVTSVDGCTIDGNTTGPGIQITTTIAATWSSIVNNNITNNGTYGIDVAAGTATTNNAAILFADYNNVYNNSTSNYHNLSAGAHDLSVDPNYTNASTGHFTPANTGLIAAAPIGFA